MSVSPVTLGSAVALGRTDQSDTQNFTLESSGRLVSEANPEQCITFSGTEKKEGEGRVFGSSHAPLSLEACNDANKDYQTWTLNKP